VSQISFSKIAKINCEYLSDLQYIIRIRDIVERKVTAKMPKLISFETIMMASKVRIEWDAHFGFKISHRGNTLNVRGDGRTTHYRLLQYVAGMLGVPERAIQYPIIPDSVYKLGDWTGSISGDWQEFEDCIQTKAQADLSEDWCGLELTFEDFLDAEVSVAWTYVNEKRMKRLTLGEGEKQLDDKAVIVRGRVPFHNGRHLMPRISDTAIAVFLEEVEWKCQLGTEVPSVEDLLGAEQMDNATRAAETDYIEESTLGGGAASPLWDNGRGEPCLAPAPRVVQPRVVAGLGAQNLIGVRPRDNGRGIEGLADTAYNSGVRAMFRMTMPDEAWIFSLKSTDGGLARAMMGRDKKTATVKIGELKKFARDEPRSLGELLVEIHRLAGGNTATGATLFKQILTDFAVDLTSYTVVNRSAASGAPDGAV
jgi:hypothetical protein